MRLAVPSTRAEIRRLIKTDTEFDIFSDACTWPDHPRKRAGEHFVNLARDSSGLTSDTCPGAHECVVSAIRKDAAVLASSDADDSAKLEALKFLGHWVGDVHQPLHVSFEDDRGGNNITVTGECQGKLHAAWDSCLVVKAVGPDVADAATDLISRLPQPRSRSGRIQIRQIGPTNHSRLLNVQRRNTATTKVPLASFLPRRK